MFACVGFENEWLGPVRVVKNVTGLKCLYKIVDCITFTFSKVLGETSVRLQELANRYSAFGEICDEPSVVTDGIDEVLELSLTRDIHINNWC